MNSSGKPKKKVVLMLAKNFLSYHKDAGNPTFFEHKIKTKTKLHTIRGNYEQWKKKIDSVRAGEAELIIKEWSGRPYHSTPNELFIYDDKDEIDVSKLIYEEGKLIVNDEVVVPPEIIAKNDGLTLDEFEDWFKVFPAEPMAIIHLTGFRYKSDKFDNI